MLELQSIAIKVSERHSLVFCKLLQYPCIRHEILFHSLYNGAVIICEKQVDDTRYLVPKASQKNITCSDTFTKSTGIKESRYKSLSSLLFVSASTCSPTGGIFQQRGKNLLGEGVHSSQLIQLCKDNILSASVSHLYILHCARITFASALYKVLSVILASSLSQFAYRGNSYHA